MIRLSASFDRSRLAALFLFLYLAASTVFVVDRYVSLTADEWRDPRITDFNIFYAAGGLVVSRSHALLYTPGPLPLSFPDAYKPAHTNYYNPPLLALLYSPLTALGVVPAYHVLVAVMAAVGVLLAALCSFWRRRPAAVALATLAVASFWPVYSTLRLGNMSLLFAVVAGLSLIALEEKRSATAGLLVSFLALKPSIAVVPLGFLGWLGNKRAIGAAAAGVILFVLLPFLFLGAKSIDDYRVLLTATRADSFTLKGGISGGANFMFNWNGFIARLFETDPKPILVLPFDLATAALAIKVWTGGELRAGWAAGTLATLLAMPHMLWYDWVLLLPAGIALALTRPGWLLIGLLALLHFSVNVSTYQMETLPRFSSAIFVATPAAFIFLAYLAFEREIGARLGRQHASRPPLISEVDATVPKEARSTPDATGFSVWPGGRNRPRILQAWRSQRKIWR